MRRVEGCNSVFYGGEDEKKIGRLCGKGKNSLTVGNSGIFKMIKLF
jgi:hypothetical protein